MGGQSSTDKPAAAATPEDPSTTGLKQSIVTIVICLIALALYATSFIFTSYTLGGGKDHNDSVRSALPKIVAPGIAAGIILFIGCALFIVQTDNIKIIYGFLVLTILSFTMSYIALAISAPKAAASGWVLIY